MIVWDDAHIVPCRVGSLRTRLPGGGAGRLDGSSEPARLTEGVLFDEWLQLKVTNVTPFAAARHETEV